MFSWKTLFGVLVFILVGFGIIGGWKLFSSFNHLNDKFLKEKEEKEKLQVENLRLILENEELKKDDFYLVIDRKGGKFSLKKRDKIIREGQCATGKGKRWFRDQWGRMKEWDFDTPTGERLVDRVEKYPRWNRPDWFWLEQGLNVPSPDDIITISDKLPPGEAVRIYNSLSKEEKLYVRSVPGFLGKYKISLGDGYFIHYGDISGRQVSHGCIRVAKEDLDAIQELMSVGSSVFIY